MDMENNLGDDFISNDIHKLFSNENFFYNNEYCFSKHSNVLIYNYFLVNKFLFDVIKNFPFLYFTLVKQYKSNDFFNTLKDDSDGQLNTEFFINNKKEVTDNMFFPETPLVYLIEKKQYLIHSIKEYQEIISSLLKPVSLDDFSLFLDDINNVSQGFFPKIFFTTNIIKNQEQWVNEHTMEVILEENVPIIAMNSFYKHFNHVDLLSKFFYEPLLCARINNKNLKKDIRISKKI